MHIYIYTSMYRYLYMCMYVYTYIYIHMYLHIHIYVYVFVYIHIIWTIYTWHNVHTFSICLYYRHMLNVCIYTYVTATCRDRLCLKGQPVAFTHVGGSTAIIVGVCPIVYQNFWPPAAQNSP